MREFVEKKIKLEKIFRVLVITIPVLFQCVFIAMVLGVENPLIYIAFLILMAGMIACFITYFSAICPFVRNINWLNKKGLGNIADDITLENPTIPKTKIYCGQYAVFCKKPCVIVPYAEMAWVYLYERRVNGIPVEKSVIVHTRDRKRFTLNVNANELRWLLENYIIKFSPDIIIGYGAEQKQRYLEIEQKQRDLGVERQTANNVR